MIVPVLADDPYADFVPDSISGAEPLNVSFTDLSYNTPTSWMWNRTDVVGANVPITFSVVQNPTYQFAAGNWCIQLITTNAYGTNTTPVNTIFVNVTGGGSAPVANFTADNTNPFPGEAVHFTDLSTNSPTSWSWRAGPDSGHVSIVSTDQNPTLTFTDTIYGNVWQVELYAYNAYGLDHEVKYAYVTVNLSPLAPPVANFTPLGEGGTITIESNETVYFNDTSTNTPTSWNWSVMKCNTTCYFVYGNTQNFNYTFPYSTSWYKINMTATNAVGSDTATRYVYTSAPPVAPLTQFYCQNQQTGEALINVGNGYNGSLSVRQGDTVNFYDSSYNTPTSWVWQIAAGNGSSYTYYAQNPTFAFLNATPGYYGITFTTTNDGGSNVLSLPNFIHIVDTTAPDAVTGITATTGPAQLEWNWTNPATDFDHAMIWKDGIAQNNTTAHAVTWTGLTPETAYQIAIKAVDAYGNIGSFANATATTNGTMWNITSDTNWVCPAGVTSVTAQMVGGGGSGAGSYTNTPPTWSYSGLGGEAGEYATYLIDVVPGTIYPITIGLRGENKSSQGVNAGLSAGNSGTGTTAFGHTVQGGVGGQNRYPNATADGGNGEEGVWSTVRMALNGTSDSGTGGIAGLGYGAGGAGAGAYDDEANATIGGYGAGGAVIITAAGYSTSTNVPDFAADITETTPSSLIHFTDISTIIDTAGLTYNWSFGDGYYSDTIGDVQHVYAYSGIYDVALSLTTANGTVSTKKSGYIKIYASAGGTKITYPPKDVRFHVQTIWGGAIAGAHVSANASQTTLGEYSYVASLFGYSLSEVPLNTLILNGTTDSRGDITFAMMADTQYLINATATGYTFVPFTVTPHDDNYIILAQTAAGSPFVQNGTPLQANVYFTANQYRYNETAALLVINYTDTTAATTNGEIAIYTQGTSLGNTSAEKNTFLSTTFTGNQTTKSYILIDKQLPGCPSSTSAILDNSTGAVVSCMNVTLVNDKSYSVVAKGITASGNVSAQNPVWFKNLTNPISGLSAVFALFFALGIMMFTSLMSKKSTAPAIALCVVFEGWVFYGMNCFNLIDRPLLGGDPTGWAPGSGLTLMNALLTVATFICFLYLFVSYRRDNK